MTIDAAEIARLRDNLQRCPEQLGFMSVEDMRALLAELEKARDELIEERATREIERDLNDDQLAEAERLRKVYEAERDAAHALLQEAVLHREHELNADLRARIAAALGDKP